MMDNSQFTSAELAEKCSELAEIVSALEQRAPEFKAELDTAATVAELVTLRADRAEAERAEHALSQARTEYHQHMRDLDEQRAALKGVRALLGARQAVETQTIRDNHTRNAIEWFERRPALVDRYEALAAQLETAACAIADGDRAADVSLMRGGLREFSTPLDPQKLGRGLRWMLLAMAPRLAEIAALAVGDRSVANRVAAGGFAQLRRPVDTAALRARLAPDGACVTELEEVAA